MKQDLMVLKQLPIIEENLKAMSEIIDSKVENANKLVANEETKQELKNVRAELNKEFAELETQRKEIKNKVLKPYEDFENIYKEFISSKYKYADETLKAKIDSVENTLKEEKEDKVKSYFNELVAQKKIDFVNYEQLGIKVTLSTSEKSLKEQVKAYIDKVSSDLQTIWNLDNCNEVLVEYKKTLDLNQSIQEVAERHKELERIEETKSVEKTTEKPIPKVEQLAKPKEVDTKIYTFKLIVKGNREKLIALRNFLQEGGYEYESR